MRPGIRLAVTARAQDGEIVLDVEVEVPDESYGSATFPTERCRGLIIDAGGQVCYSDGLSGGATGGRVTLHFSFPAGRWFAAETVRLEIGKIEFSVPIADLGALAPDAG